MTSLFSKVAESPTFVAFNAHAGFAFFCLTVCEIHRVNLLSAALVALALAAIKEFYIDPHYETDPPQNVWPDGAIDFAGYATGVALAAWLL